MSRSAHHRSDHRRSRNDRSASPRDRRREEPRKKADRRRGRAVSHERSRHRRRSRSPREEVRAPISRWEDDAERPQRSSPPQRMRESQAVTSEEKCEDAPNGGRNLQRNLKTSGLLSEEFSTYKGVVIKYNEPTEAAMPQVRWRVYVFKPGCEPEKLYIHRQSAYLVSRDRKIADIPFDHPSISKQHAVLQYRKTGAGVTLYLMDLDSANGTLLNGKKLDPRRYYEILQKDVVKFGFSSRECVFLTEDALDGDNE